MPPRQIPKSTTPSRSPPPPSPPHPPPPPSQSQPSPAARTMGKIVRLPTRSGSASNPASAGSGRSFVSRPSTTTSAPPGSSTSRPVSNPVRKRPSLSPPPAAARPVARQESPAPGGNGGSRGFLWQRDSSPAPVAAAVAGSTAPAQTSWKRRRQGAGDAAAVAENSEVKTNHIVATPEKVEPKPQSAPEPQIKTPPPSPPKPAMEAPPQEVIKPSLDQAPIPIDEAIAPSTPAVVALTAAKPLDQPAAALDPPAILTTVVVEEAAGEAVQETAAEEEEEVELEETEFDRMMAESDEWMRRSTAWISAALRSISSDVAKAAESEAGKAQLGALLRMSIAEVLEPVSRHAEAMGEAAAAMEDSLAESRAEEALEQHEQMDVVAS